MHNNKTQDNKKSSNITIIGKPNAGKSTLLNRLIGQKIAIVTPKVQTTRSSITGIFTKDNTQLVFIDTPGIFAPHTKLEKAMVRCAWSNVAGADQVIFLIDVTKEFDDKSIEIVNKLKSRGILPIFVLNKIDRKKSNIEAIEKVITDIINDATLYKISALSGKGIDELVEYLQDKATGKEWLYGEDDITNLPMRFLASEITREQLFLQLQDELPYNLTVESEAWENLSDGSVKINQVIIVNKQNYKAMILGNKGERIKNIGTKSREEITIVLGLKVHLFLFVKVREDWDNNPLSYEYMGLSIN